MTENHVSLKVIHENGEIETIYALYPAFLGRGKVLNKLFCSDGTEYYFTKDGYYDGWAKPIEVGDNGKEAEDAA